MDDDFLCQTIAELDEEICQLKSSIQEVVIPIDHHELLKKLEVERSGNVSGTFYERLRYIEDMEELVQFLIKGYSQSVIDVDGKIKLLQAAIDRSSTEKRRTQAFIDDQVSTITELRAVIKRREGELSKLQTEYGRMKADVDVEHGSVSRRKAEATLSRLEARVLEKRRDDMVGRCRKAEEDNAKMAALHRSAERSGRIQVVQGEQAVERIEDPDAFRVQRDRLRFRHNSLRDEVELLRDQVREYQKAPRNVADGFEFEERAARAIILESKELRCGHSFLTQALEAERSWVQHAQEKIAKSERKKAVMDEQLARDRSHFEAELSLASQGDLIAGLKVELEEWKEKVRERTGRVDILGK